MLEEISSCNSKQIIYSTYTTWVPDVLKDTYNATAPAPALADHRIKLSVDNLCQIPAAGVLAIAVGVDVLAKVIPGGVATVGGPVGLCLLFATTLVGPPARETFDHLSCEKPRQGVHIS